MTSPISPETKKTCRLCHRSTGRLVSPCACDGSIKYVHSKCLAQWASHRQVLKCEVCGAAYSVAKVIRQEAGRTRNRGLLALLWMHGRRSMRRCLSYLAAFFLGFFVLVVALLLHTCIYYFVFPPPYMATPLAPASWVAPKNTDAFLKCFAASMKFALSVGAMYSLWRAWNYWFVHSMEQGVVNIREELFGGPVANAQVVINLDADEENSDDDTSNDPVGGDAPGQTLELAVLPKETSTILEVITLARERNDKRYEANIVTEALSVTVVPYAVFTLVVRVVCELGPEALRIVLEKIWKTVHGSDYLQNGGGFLMSVFSPTSGTAGLRYAMLESLVTSLRASTLMHLVAILAASSFTASVFLFLVKRLRHFQYRTTLISLLAFIRGISNLTTFVCVSLPTVCIVATLLCMNFAGVGIRSGDTHNGDKTAWNKFVVPVGSEMKYITQLYSHASGGTALSPLGVLKSLVLIPRLKQRETCIDYDLALAFQGSNKSLYDRIGVLDDGEADDAVAYVLFASSVALSTIDAWLLVEGGYALVILVAVQVSHLLLSVSFLPVDWTRWSALCRFLTTNICELLISFGGGAFIRMYLEAVFIVGVVSGIFLPYSVALCHALNLKFANILAEGPDDRLFCSLCLLFFYPLYNMPSFYSALVKNYAFGVVEKFFHAEELVEETCSSWTQLISSTLRFTALIICNISLAIVLTTIYFIPGIFMLAQRKLVVCTAWCVYHCVFLTIRVAYPHIVRDLHAVMLGIPSVCNRQVALWWRRWRLGLCCGVWVSEVVDTVTGTVRYKTTPIKGIPVGDVGNIFFDITLACYRLHRLSAKCGDGRAAQLLVKLICHTSIEGEGCTLSKEEIDILISLLRYPSFRRVLTFIFFTAALLFVLPSLVGLCSLTMARYLFFTPHCFVASSYLLGLLSWMCGMMVLTIRFTKTEGTNSYTNRVVVYLCCGCYYLSLRRAFVLVVVPAFMRLAAVANAAMALHIISFLSIPNIGGTTSSADPLLPCLQVVAFLVSTKLLRGAPPAPRPAEERLGLVHLMQVAQRLARRAGEEDGEVSPPGSHETTSDGAVKKVGIFSAIRAAFIAAQAECSNVIASCSEKVRVQVSSIVSYMEELDERERVTDVFFTDRLVG
uniref:RING-type E3 ubiquitin transferase n=1 Tax=Trypanosoma congolense (strain IL3000) TaxID=1068625 RepID=F9WG68_TRYCI|nr:unnamed protein product [Trypanosoma congolense IL3000]